MISKKVHHANLLIPIAGLNPNDNSPGDFSKETGHFTQLVWKNTTSVGCGRTECNGDGGNKAPGWYVVCEYYPPGNVVGAFTSMVQGQVPENEQPEGPSDPQVPQDDGKKECPQGGVCGGGGKVRGEVGALWVAVLVACLGTLGWL